MVENRCRVRVLIPLALGLAILLGSFLFSIRRHKEAAIEAELASTLRAVPHAFQNELQSDADTMSAVLRALALNEQVRSAFRSRDRAQLLALVTPVFDQLRAEHHITHFYFSDSLRVNLLRVHQPHVHGDTVDRHTTLTAESTREISHGLEFGPLGTLALRVVMPWYDQEGLIGYVELSEEITHIIPRVCEACDAELFVTVDKQHLYEESWKTRQELLGVGGDWDQFPECVVFAQTLEEIPRSVSDYLPRRQHEHGVAWVSAATADGQRYRGAFLPLRDARGVAIGDLIAMRNVTKELAAANAAALLSSVTWLAVGGILLAFFYVFLGRVERRLVEVNQRLEVLATTDELTGLMNRRAIVARLEEELTRSRREGTPLSLIMMDLDNFKQVNDERGHTVGDAVLKECCRRLTAATRPYDQLGRMGGDEFLLLLPGAKQDAALAVAERMRSAIGNESFPRGAGPPFRLTASLGVTEAVDAPSTETILTVADNRLYGAKALGGDRACGLPCS